MQNKIGETYKTGGNKGCPFCHAKISQYGHQTWETELGISWGFIMEYACGLKGRFVVGHFFEQDYEIMSICPQFEKEYEWLK